MKTRPMAKEVRQMIIDSEIEFKEIDYNIHRVLVFYTISWTSLKSLGK